MSAYQDGILVDGVPLVINSGGQSVPATITLNSAATARLIRISTNGEAGSFIPVNYTGNTATMISATIDAPIRAIEVTGQAGDKWEIR